MIKRFFEILLEKMEKSTLVTMLVLFILIGIAYAANVTIGNLAADGSPGLTDLVEIEQSDNSASNKATIGSVLAAGNDLDSSGDVANDSHTHQMENISDLDGEGTAGVLVDDGDGSFTVTQSMDTDYLGAFGAVGIDTTPDTDDTYGGILLKNWNCGESVAQWDAVYLDDTANEWLIADADAAGKWPARGIAVAACTDGNPGSILVQGVVRNDGWTWTANGATLFLGDGGTGSTLTQTAPSTSGDCVQVVGWTIDDDDIYVNFSGHYLEVQ